MATKGIIQSGMTLILSALLSLLLCGGPGPPPAAAHEDVWLRNEHGDRISPSQNRADAYSPKKTCGGCHNYGLITSGDHFAHLTRSASSANAPGASGGALEGDCLVCHMPNYRMGGRNREIAAGRYAWAATAGAGIGEIKGPQLSPGQDAGAAQRPFVSYHWTGGAFTSDGRMKGSRIQKHVASANCLQCHQAGMAGDSGTLFSAGSDVHAKAGIRCSDCHQLVSRAPGGRMAHYIARGKHAKAAFRRELIGADMMTCAVCHVQGKYVPRGQSRPKTAKIPAAKHAEKFPGASFHFYLMDCSACHITAQAARGGYLLDMSAGERTWYTADALEYATRQEELTRKAANPWQPWLCRTDPAKTGVERYAPCLPRVSQWFGTKLPDGRIKPIPPPTIKSVAASLKGLTKVEVKAAGGRKITTSTAATADDIRLALQALAGKGYPRAVFVSDRVYELKKGSVVAAENELLTSPAAALIHHGVQPLDAKKTYGAAGKPDGCVSCHSDTAAFFAKPRILRIGQFLKEDYPVPKEPNARPRMSDWGMTGVPAHE